MDALASPGLSRHRGAPTPLWRHLAHFGPLLVLSILAAWLASRRLADDVPLVLRWIYALVVGANVAVLAMSSWSTLLGVAVAGLRRVGLKSSGLREAAPTGGARTAVLIPIFEEDAVRVFATASTMRDALAAEAIGHIDVFVLSDTRSEVVAAHEEAMAVAVARSHEPSIYYRRRQTNTGRKAGNIADFCERWGAAYDFMVVLDADSLMTGAAVARLVGLMEANPDSGLIQAMCYPTGRRSGFARLQQFGARLYGPIFQKGVSWWQGPRGNFWGHNAIIRLEAFAAACGLPLLPGRPPFGGEILSHDTVEAALMLRAGYDVWMLPDGLDGRHGGSWEETPTNLLDHLERDRRWCRGNLQHAMVVGARGLRLASIYHITRGLLHYLYAPLFVAWLILYALVDRGVEADALAWLLVALVLAPRLLCLSAALVDREQVEGFGGRPMLLAGAALDQVVSALSFPATLTFHLLFLADAAVGGETRWHGQVREDRGLRWGETARQLGPPLVVALAALALLAPLAPFPAALLAPGIIATLPLAVWTSRGLGSDLLHTPDDLQPHPIHAARNAVERRLRGGERLDPGSSQARLPPRQGLSMRPQVLRTTW